MFVSHFCDCLRNPWDFSKDNSNNAQEAERARQQQLAQERQNEARRNAVQEELRQRNLDEAARRAVERAQQRRNQ